EDVIDLFTLGRHGLTLLTCGLCGARLYGAAAVTSSIPWGHSVPRWIISPLRRPPDARGDAGSPGRSGCRARARRRVATRRARARARGGGGGRGPARSSRSRGWGACDRRSPTPPAGAAGPAA